jgi:hypothetical protein
MTWKDYIDVLEIMMFAIVFMAMGAGIVELVGAERLARWLRLPYTGDEDR